MINRSLLINTKDVKGDAIGYFATLLNIKNYFSFEEESYETVDQSFHDKREDWFEYEKLLGDFNYILDIGMYVDYDTFICLIKYVSLNGFKIAIPDELQVSPFVYDLLDNGKFLKVLILEEEKKDSEDIEHKLIYENNLKSNVLFEQFNINNSKFWNKVIILFLYWASEKNILSNQLQVVIEKLKKEFDLLTENNLILIYDNIRSEKLLSGYFNKSSVEFVKFYIYYSKKFFFDIIKSSNENNIFNSYLMDLNERNIQGIDYVKLWIEYKERDTFTINKNKFYELLNIFDKRYQEYCGNNLKYIECFFQKKEKKGFESKKEIPTITLKSNQPAPRTGLYEATLPKEHPKESWLSTSGFNLKRVKEGENMGTFGLSEEDEALIVWKYVGE